ncbi:hypothetical protein SAMN05216207_106718 [Pseudonocardia ammonioxydans]|uniref:Uncharacterized protein n=1 Tax=Pseudonocardia ammonioxydans TaxID=260086 RepID=A0A1I5HK84_PSUAM|nr:hypothetical protein SAMN05216207_106718 [Pseudonocardia ammonioxydans]
MGTDASGSHAAFIVSENGPPNRSHIFTDPGHSDSGVVHLSVLDQASIRT